MGRNDVRERVREVVSRCGPLHEPPTDDQKLFYVAATESSLAARSRGEYGLDSLDRVEIGINLEEAFDIDLPDDEIDVESFDTVDQITDLIVRKLKEVGHV